MAMETQDGLRFHRQNDELTSASQGQGQGANVPVSSVWGGAHCIVHLRKPVEEMGHTCLIPRAEK